MEFCFKFSVFLPYVEYMSLVALITVCIYEYIYLYIHFPHEFVSFLGGEPMTLILVSFYL